MIIRGEECKINPGFCYAGHEVCSRKAGKSADMESISLKAYAKINIGLDITGKREDGYHLLKTVMQTVGIYDVVTAQKNPRDFFSGCGGADNAVRIKGGGNIIITSDKADVPEDKTNIAAKAAKAVMEKYGITDNIRIHIEKHIPMAAGLAGGSADGAAAIKALDRLFCLGMDRKTMDETAVRLGADVAFCLRRGIWLCEGIGEILTELPPLSGICAVIVKPDFEVSTKWCYEEYDRLNGIVHPDMDAAAAAIRAGDFKGLCAKAGNVLEYASCPAYPQIDEMKAALLRMGAGCALMSGSGGTAFGLFDDRKKARAALEFFKGCAHTGECFLTELV